MSTKNQDDPIVGIDLGTTNSLIAYCDESGPRILVDDTGERLLPSVVRLGADGAVAVGREARDHAVEFPHQTVHSVKRLMGRGSVDVADELALLPYEVVEGDHQTARVHVAGRVWSPPEISAIYLRTLRDRAEHVLGLPVRRAVVTVPAYFDDAQRQATRDAGRIAGLQVVRIVNEPTAAALAYGIGARGQGPGAGEVQLGDDSRDGARGGDMSLNTKFRPEACTQSADDDDQRRSDPTSPQPSTPSPCSTIAVFDLGGGTFDISILRLQVAAGGGGVSQVLATSGDTHLGGDDVDQMIVQLVFDEIHEQFGRSLDFPASARQAVRQFAEATKIRLSQADSGNIQVDLGDGRVYERTLTCDELDRMITPWVDRAMSCCEQALRAAGVEVVERVVMVGGSTRIPLVRRRVAELFNVEPYTALNPDEVVALGAAVQASILAGVNRDMLLLDVIPLSLGIETMGGAVAKLITANTTIPARATEMFTTYAEGQTNVKIHVLQGERELVKDCRSLGEFDLHGIPPMPAGLPKIDVTFLIDANGVLNVSAVERRSEKAASIQIVPNHGLTRQEVDQITAASIEHAREDMTAHRLIDLRNQARLDMRAIERQLAKVGSDVDDAYRQQIKVKLAAVGGVAGADQPDADAFSVALTDLDHSTVRLAEMAITRTLQEDKAAAAGEPPS